MCISIQLIINEITSNFTHSLHTQCTWCIVESVWTVLLHRTVVDGMSPRSASTLMPGSPSHSASHVSSALQPKCSVDEHK